MNENENLISIVMPAYNAEKFIGESIESIIAQTYKNWELIVVDDGSKDNTKNIVNNYISGEPRIKYFYQQNGKQGKSRNTGIKNAKGNLIAFLDADDLWISTKLKKQVLLMKQMAADVVFTYITHIDSEGKKIARGETGSSHEIYYGDEGLALFFKMNIIPIFTVLASRKAILEVNGFNEAVEIQNIEDYDLWLRMLQNNSKFLLMNEVLGAYRIHGNQTVKGKPSVIKILKMLSEMKVEKKNLAIEKEKAICLWMLRCLKYNINKEELKNVISFYPRYAGRFLFKNLYNILPHKLLIKIISFSCKEQPIKNTVTYIRQKKGSSLRLSF